MNPRYQKRLAKEAGTYPDDSDPGDEHREPVAYTKRHREVHLVPWKGGWKIEVEGGGMQPFANHHFTRYELARHAIIRWQQEKG